MLVFTLMACSNSSPGTSGNNYGNTGNSGAQPTAASTTGSALRTTSATLNGKTVTLLTNAQGMTLYYFKPDTPTTAACTGGCASTWPPLLASGAVVPASATSLPGKLTVQANTNGSQVEYNDHPLYNYSGDSAPSQTNGEGIGNQWFVATTDLTMNNGGGSATPRSNPYGNNSGY
jgi:predicted lipoprotein with Yx(FWY)xxD motif